MKETFLYLLRLGLWGKTDDTQEVNLTEAEWIMLYQMAAKQKVYGFIFDGICQLPEKPNMPEGLWQQWCHDVQVIEQQNKLQLMQLIQLQYFYQTQHNIPFRLLKGHGIARHYRNPLRRFCGDYDLWFRSPADVERANVAMEKAGYPVQRGHYDDSAFGWNGQEIEHHYHLIELHNPFMQKGLLKWEEQIFDESKEYPTPCADLLLQITHILKHQLNGGIGFRQICDLAVSLMTYEYDAQELERLCKKFHIYKWTKLLLALVQKVLHVPDEKLPFPTTENPDAMLNEIWEAGDFGHGDTRWGNRPKGKWASKFYTFSIIWHKTKIFFLYAPDESFWWQAQLALRRIGEALHLIKE